MPKKRKCTCCQYVDFSDWHSLGAALSAPGWTHPCPAPDSATLVKSTMHDQNATTAKSWKNTNDTLDETESSTRPTPRKKMWWTILAIENTYANTGNEYYEGRFKTTLPFTQGAYVCMPWCASFDKGSAVQHSQASTWEVLADYFFHRRVRLG